MPVKPTCSERVGDDSAVHSIQFTHMELTPRCQIAIDNAKRGQAHLGHPYLSSAHLVLGLLWLSGVGPERLKAAGLSTDSVGQYLASNQLSTEETVEREGTLFGKSAAEAFARARIEAETFGHTYLGVEHLVLALLAEESGDAAELFASIPMDRDRSGKLFYKK